MNDINMLYHEMLIQMYPSLIGNNLYQIQFILITKALLLLRDLNQMINALIINLSDMLVDASIEISLFQYILLYRCLGKPSFLKDLLHVHMFH